MKKQEIFDTVVAHLLKQNAQSKTDGSCSYRGADGAMCAVGCLIKDEFYDSEIEGYNLEEEKVVIAVENSIGKLGVKKRRLLDQLQWMHDDWSPEKWKERCKEIAEEQGLKFNKAKYK